jgi:phosphoribosylamine-glycine ligase
MLENVSKESDIAKPQFELQSFAKGVALSTELWFQNGEYIAPLTNHTLERKELMNDDVGPSGGCVGNVVWLCDGCPVCEAAKCLVPWCEAHRYHGPLDLNAIVAKDSIYGLEFTPRFGYDATPTFLWELVRGDLGDFFSHVARGDLRDIDVATDTFGAALRVTIPPWPSEKHTAEENVPIRGIDTERNWFNNTYLYNVKADDEGNLVSAGAWGILVLLTHHATTVSGSFRPLVERAGELKIKNKQFRTDLAERFKQDLSELGGA